MSSRQNEHSELKSALPGEGLVGEFDISKFLQIVRSSWWVILILFFAGFAGSYLFLRYTVPLFESYSILKLDIKSDSGVLGLETFSGSNRSSTVLSGEVELIKSDLIHNLVIDDLKDLEISYYSKGKIKDEERFRTAPFKVEVIKANANLHNVPIHIKIIDKNTFELELENDGQAQDNRFRFGELIKSENAEFRITIKDVDQEQFNLDGYYFILNSRNHLLRYMKQNLQVGVLNPTANTISISFQDPNRFKAKAIVKTINAVYLSETLALKKRASSQTINFLNYQLARTDSLLGNSEKEIEDFIREHKTTNILEEVNEVNVEIEALKDEMEMTRLEIRWIDNFELKFSNQDSLGSYLEIGYFPNELLQQASAELYRAKEEFNKVQFSSKESTLIYQYKKEGYENSISQMKLLIKDERNRLLEKLDMLRKKSRELEDELSTLPERRTEYNRLKRYYDLNEKFYLLLMDKKAEYGISEAGTVPEFQILSPANLPTNRISPLALNVYVAGMGMAVAFSLLFVFFKFLTHNTIDTLEEVENIVDTPIIGAVPKRKSMEGSHSQLVIHHNPKSAISEAFRTIRTNMDFISPNGNDKLISVTSTVSGEGKTFVAANLGGIISMSNKKVIILDLDMRKPKVHLVFDGDNGLGMSNILIGKNSFSDCVKTTELENLFYIPSGPIPPNPSELILLESFDKLLKDLAQEFDLIIMDSPPVGLVTDGVLLMKKASIPIYVVRAGFTKKGFHRVIESLTVQNHVRNLSIIFNGQNMKRGSKYGYGYGYGYGAGYYEEKKEKAGIFRLFA